MIRGESTYQKEFSKFLGISLGWGWSQQTFPIKKGLVEAHLDPIKIILFHIHTIVKCLIIPCIALL